jgi:hypothetical protein
MCLTVMATEEERKKFRTSIANDFMLKTDKNGSALISDSEFIRAVLRSLHETESIDKAITAEGK